MDKFSKSLLFLISLSLFALVSCSPANTQSENTAIGAVTGAVVGGLAGSAIGGGAGQAIAIGVGAVAGALIGGAIGQSMDSSDNTRMYQVLDNNPENRGTSWVNKHSNTRYTVIPTSDRMTINGNPNCREYRALATINGKKEHIHGVACRNADGTWKAVNNQ